MKNLNLWPVSVHGSKESAIKAIEKGHVSWELNWFLHHKACWSLASDPVIRNNFCLYDHVVGLGSESASWYLVILNEPYSLNQDVCTSSDRAILWIDYSNCVRYEISRTSSLFVFKGFRPRVRIQSNACWQPLTFWYCFHVFNNTTHLSLAYKESITD